MLLQEILLFGASQVVFVAILGHSKCILAKLAIICLGSRAVSIQLPFVHCVHSRSLHLRWLQQMVMIRPNTMAKCEAGGSTLEIKIAKR